LENSLLKRINDVLFKQIKKVSVKLPLQKQDALIIHDNNQAIKHGVINETKPKSNM
tara:strand:- start:349 stop:516 length:168 start_codon:yes stop_codon:yes gene_type:complete